MKLRIQKLHPEAIAPQYATADAACFDLHCIIDHPRGVAAVFPGERYIFGTGLAFEVPHGHMLQIRSRSGAAFKHGVTAFHGTIDADYRGEVSVLLHNAGPETLIFKSGDRIAQACIVPSPRVQIEVAEQLSLTERGAGGFGSTGVA